MTTAILLALLFAHLVACCIVAVMMWRGILRVPGAFIVIVALIPAVGVISMIGVERTLRRRYDPHRGDRVLNVGKGEIPFGMITIEGGDSHAVVPLEEALLINDTATRREILQDVLRRDPVRFMELLKVARLNEDMEVTHYATTTIMEIQRDFELSLQKLDKELLNRRGDPELTDEAIEVLSRYVSSGLLEGYSQQRIQQRYRNVLEQKFETQESDRQTLLRLADSRISLGDVAGAADAVERLVNRWPADEEAWLLGLRVAVASGDRQVLAAWLKRMKSSSVFWSYQGKDILNFWMGADTSSSEDASASPVVAQ